MTYKLHLSDCIEWMEKQNEKSIDCIITSPPYNINVKYEKYQDKLSTEEYLKWIYNVGVAMKRVLKDNGQIFFNVGHLNIEPWVAMDVAQTLRDIFVLQNNFIWVKHIAINDQGYGQYKPITSDRFSSVTTENIFHFTKNGNVKINRTAIGQRNKSDGYKYPELYSENRHIATQRRKAARRMGSTNWKTLKEKNDALKSKGELWAAHDVEESQRYMNEYHKQSSEYNSILAELLQKNPYNPDKKKCIGNAWYIPYIPTSKLAKEIGVKGDTGTREKSRGSHPATFPENLPEQCIKYSGISKGSVVYDPFLGTGTTIVAALKLDMIAIGTDIDQKYLNFAEDRISNII